MIHDPLTSPFNPIQVPCVISENFVFTVCLTEAETAFFSIFEEKQCYVCPVGKEHEFETIDMKRPIISSLVHIEKKVTGVYYTLTELGKKLIEALCSERSPLSNLDTNFASLVAQARRSAKQFATAEVSSASL